MAIAVEVPKLGNTVEECLIAKWRKHKGEAVSAGEVVAEIETDKATFEVTAPAGGTLLETFFEEGTLVPVFTNLFVIGEAGESAEAFRPPSAAAAPAKRRLWQRRRRRRQRPSVRPRPRPRPRLRRPGRSVRAPAGSPKSTAARDGVAAGLGPGRPGPRRRLAPAVLRFAARLAGGADAPREGAEVHGPGSGVAGMILASDVGAPAARISSIRDNIARRMRESLATTAQYTLHASANAGGLLLVRAKVKASKGVPDININDLVTFCTIQALLDVPDLNAEFIDGRIYKHGEVHIGFACDTPRGLMVPVVRDAHTLTAGELSARMKELTAQAVAGTISVDDLPAEPSP